MATNALVYQLLEEPLSRDLDCVKIILGNQQNHATYDGKIHKRVQYYLQFQSGLLLG